MVLRNLPSASDVASTSSAAPLDLGIPAPSRELHRTIRDPAKVPQISYDVFLCHRGPDTKTSLVDVLRAFLEDRGISCYVDYEMKTGVDFPSAIKQAIHNSKVHIIILSPRFAQSRWCLDEVVEIMELQASNHVLPIFFNVEPKHVRHPRSGSEFDLSQLHKGRTNDKIVQWSRALASLANIKGYEWPTRRREGHMIEEIVSRVGKFLCDCLPLYTDSTSAGKRFEGRTIQEIVSRVENLLLDRLPPYADSTRASRYAVQIEQAEQMLCLHNDEIVVSIGVRGTEKSSFAMVLYDKFRQHFPARHCILLDVKGKATCEPGLVKLQMTLFERLVNVGNTPPRIHDTVQGRLLLLDRLKHVKCFIVLDDIEDDDEQLRSLLVFDQHQLGRGSRLVLTSHYPHVLGRAQVKDTIHIETEGEVEERGKRLAICWESLNDVHVGFIRHLDESLSMLGLNVSEMRGVDLLNAERVKQADIILVILSQSFVDSRTCMEALDEAYRSCPGARFKFVCIYYGLQSERIASLESEVSSSTGLSEKALRFPVDFQNESRLDKLAFKSLIDDIVLNHMQHKYKIEVTKFPVGLRKRQEELTIQICGSISDRKKSSTFGILGMGGVGKTTLAKSLYNRIHKKFEGAIFLSDVGTTAKHCNGLQSLQERIAKVLNKGPVSIENVAEGKALLSDRLRDTHILIILDDVDHKSQLDALFSPLNLGRGSVVVITTRDHSILVDADVTYKVKCLDPENAKRLFCWHAFLKPSPPKDLELIAQEVIDACGALPLSLEVIGAHVYNQNDPEFWKGALVHLKNADKDIFQKLRVSVDALESYQVEAFLDVCCFLIGKPCHTALRIWDGCDGAALTCVDVLKRKCLINVDPTDGTIGMHDQIRDMGRHIAKGRTPKTHIWNAEDTSDITHGAINQLRGFAMRYKEFPMVHCEAFDFAKLCHSEVLLLHGHQIGEDFSNLRCDRIRWLQWQESPFEKLPPGLYCSRKLRVLDLSDSRRLETLWEDSQSGNREVPESLQELNLRGCYKLRELPQFNVYLRSLEWLSLRDCTRLSCLHDSIGSLEKLKFLNLSGCSSLRSLPDTLEGLHSLEKLDLSSCVCLQSLPEGIGKCRNLIEISLSETGVTSLPESLGALNMLRKCDLRGCTSLQLLPEKFCELTSLIRLDLSFRSSLRSLPDTIAGLLSLERIDLKCCTFLESLPEGIGKLRNLKELSLWGCEKLVALPDSLGALNMLRKCDLSRCRSLQQLPEKFCELTSLILLDLSGCSSLRSLPDTIEGLLSLEKLDLSGCTFLESLPEGIGRCRNLIDIRLYATGVTNLPESFGKLRNLKELSLCGCEKLVALPDSLGDLNMLRECNLSWCGSLQQLPEKFCELTSLIGLNLSYCDHGNLPGRIGNLRKLRTLSLRCNGRLRRLPASMSDLRSLTKLDLHGCPLEDEGLSKELFKRLASLEEMVIAGAEIRNLDVAGDNGQATPFPSSLTILSLTDCCNLEGVSGLDSLTRLECLHLRGCEKLRYLNGLEGLESLQELDISLCRALDSRRVVADTRGLAVRRLYIGESSVVPSMDLLQRPKLELLSWSGWELRGGFTDWQLVDHHRRWVDIFINLCSGEQSTMGRPSNFAAVLVSLLIPTGFFVRLSRAAPGFLLCELESCWQAKDDQVILLLFRPGGELWQQYAHVSNDDFYTEIIMRPPGLKVSYATSYKVVWGGLEEFSASACFQRN